MAERKRARIPKTLRLDDDFIIRVDDYGFSLIQHGITKSRNPKHIGKETERVVGYYFDLQAALKDYVRHIEREYLSESDIGSIQELIDKLSEKEVSLQERLYSLLHKHLNGDKDE